MYIDPTGEKLKGWQWTLIGLGIDVFCGGAFSALAGALAVGAVGTAVGAMGAAVGAIDGAVGGLITGTTAALFPFSNANYELQKYISPIAIKPPSLGSDGFGFDVSFGTMKGFGPMPAYRWHAGVSYNFGGKNKGWETRTGAEFSIGGINISGTSFTGRNPQITNKLTWGGPFFNLSYENDYMFGLGKVLGKYNADGGDRWRTAAVNINIGSFSINLNMFTGDPDVDGVFGSRYDHLGETENGKKYYKGNTALDPSMRAGMLSFGFGPFRFGRNSEAIRHVFQNQFAHDILMRGESKWFLPLDIPPSWFFSFGFGSGNTLW
jgi:hypothetical protein